MMPCPLACKSITLIIIVNSGTGDRKTDRIFRKSRSAKLACLMLQVTFFVAAPVASYLERVIMTTPFWQQTARRPRYSAAEDGQAEVLIELQDSEANEAIRAKLGNISRYGFQVIVDRALPEQAAVVVRIMQASTQLDFSFPSIVRWQRDEGESKWALGCQFEKELNWEDYGELFLRGILVTE